MASNVGSVALTSNTLGGSKERDYRLSKANLASFASDDISLFNIDPIILVLSVTALMTIIRSLVF